MCYEGTYTGTLKGMRLSNVYHMGMVIVCGDVDNTDVMFDEETRLFADWDAKD